LGIYLKNNIELDGRRAWDALELQAEGPAAITTNKAEAYTSIEKASFSGMSPRFTFDMYISAHLLGHNKLSLLGEPVSELKKVTDFLAGITAPSLSTAKENIIGDVAKIENFDACLLEYYFYYYYSLQKCLGPLLYSTHVSA
jgi:hypothetical protein